LAEAMRELEQKNGLIVTRHEEEKVSLDAGTLEIVPAWKFCLLS
jgi:hypothetical protein